MQNAQPLVLWGNVVAMACLGITFCCRYGCYLTGLGPAWGIALVPPRLQYGCHQDHAQSHVRGFVKGWPVLRRGNGGPHDAGHYNSIPRETGFFHSNGGNWDSGKQAPVPAFTAGLG
jgi:hypothetical protein